MCIATRASGAVSTTGITLEGAIVPESAENLDANAVSWGQKNGRTEVCTEFRVKKHCLLLAQFKMQREYLD